MPNQFNDINLPGFARSVEDVPPQEEPVEETEESPEPEVRLISAEWQPGPKGFLYNEQCFLDVKAEFLKPTIRTRICGKLFGTYQNEEVDQSYTVEGFINRDTGIARMNVIHVWFVNNTHYEEWKLNKRVKAQYIIKDITHSRGENNIDSPVLKMPGNGVFVFSN
jgi:hypothetical protein